MDDKLLELLVCPANKEKLKYADVHQLNELNQKIKSKKIKYQDDSELNKTWAKALVEEKSKRYYQIENDIPILLVEKSVLL